MNTKIDKVTLIDQSVRQFVDDGTMILKAGWKYASKDVVKEYPIYEIRFTDEPEHIKDLQEASAKDPSTLPVEMLEALMVSQETGQNHYPVEVDVEKVTEEVILHNHPTVVTCNPENVIPDPSCGDNLADAQFIIYSFETSISELKKAGIYSNLEDIEHNTPDPISDGEHSAPWATSGFQFSDNARKRIIAYEYWGYWDIDGSGMTTPIVATWVGNTMIRLEENPYPGQFIPFVIVPYLPVANSIMGEPDGELIEDNQAIIGAVTRGMIDLMAKSANGQTAHLKGALDPINRKKYEAGLDYEFNDVGDPQNSIYMHTFPEIPMSAYNMLNLQTQEAESLTGVRPFAGNTSDSGLGVTAANQNASLNASQRRELGILRRLSNGYRQIGHMIIAMNQVFLDESEVIRVTNGTFATIQRDDLSGKIDIRLSISTAEADEQKAQELSFMLQTTGQQFGMEMYKMILSEIADLRKMPSLAHQIRTFESQPDPMQQMEIQKMQMEIEKIKAETQKILAEAGKTQTESDRNNLDYVEEESGVSHARDMQKQSAQANANMQLEAFKSELSKESSADKPLKNKK